MNAHITPKEIAAARRVYWWLLLAPILAVPCWGFNFNWFPRHDLANSAWAAGLPLVFYFPVFLWALTGRPFVKAHARQALGLLALRFFFAVLASAGNAWDLLWFNALLWLVGSLVGLAQAGHGRAWLGHIQAGIVKQPQPVEKTGAGSTAYQLNLFRSGDPAAREEALRRLQELGQVETF